MWTCKNCSEVNGPDDGECRRCRAPKVEHAPAGGRVSEESREAGRQVSGGARIRQLFEPTEGAESPPPSTPSVQGKPPQYFISVLKVCGTIDLVASIAIGALFILEAVFFKGHGLSFFIAVGLIFQGFVFYALLNVVGLMLENLIGIRELLSGETKMPGATNGHES